ncbi:MAG: polysaccharide deacetylase family protein, partial [Lentisphaerae bacterium]|nr:polysaccharide deacetylase family protein [Lentisphaerota bacterium]
MLHHIPFQERKTPWRGVLDLVTGRYPVFLFGGQVGNLLPMFHFHDVTTAYLTPYFKYLAENRYRTVNAEDIAGFVRDGRHPGPRTVALCFDDAWASLWTVVLPLLQKHNLTAISYAIPGRVADAAAPRPQTDHATHTGPPLATWPELRALQSSGLVDVQAHTHTHAMIFCHDQPCGFITPAYRPAALAEPFTGTAEAPAFLQSHDLGEPLYPLRSRCSDARRFFPAPAARQACRDHVAQHGGKAYFQTPQWQLALIKIMRADGGTWETPED